LSQLYQVRHITRYEYEEDITENVMEVRKCPLTRSDQRCMSFRLEVEPSAKMFRFEESSGNIVHHFDIPQRHKEMTLTAESLVELKDDSREASSPCDWSSLKPLQSDPDYLEYLLPSPMVDFTESLKAYYGGVKPADDEKPPAYLERLNSHLASNFAYVPCSTQVDSSIDEALSKNEGVCQDFAHIMLGLTRLAGIPARYVSGYLFQSKEHEDRSSDDASHAWVEAYLPEAGWVGFDPTNDIRAGNRHIVVCFGRDYSDVPPTRGVYRGQCGSEIRVAVQVELADSPTSENNFRSVDGSDLSKEGWGGVVRKRPGVLTEQVEQQQQQ